MDLNEVCLIKIIRLKISYTMAQRPKPKEQKKVIDATVIDEEILK